MINIRGPGGDLLAILEDYEGDEISEEINGAYTLKFTAFIDDSGKADYIVDGNSAEVDGQFFPIVHHVRTRGTDGTLIVAVECEHTSYILNNHTFDEGFVQAGTPAALMALVLAGSGCAVGTVDVGTYVSIDAAEEGVTARSLLLEIAAQSGGDLFFENRLVSLLQDRGADRGVEFRVGKNLVGLTKDVDVRSGSRVVSYSVDVLELSQLKEYGDLESYRLGDTVRVLDDELGVDELQRVVKYSYSPRQRTISKVEISNVMAGLEDRVTQIRSSAVFKGKVYNGTSISPEDGFVAERSDKLARAIFNATDGIRLQSGSGSGSYTDAIYFNFAGDAVFTGIVTGSEFIGGSITIGSGQNVFRADNEGIWAGASVKANAPFQVDMFGKAKLVDGEFEGIIRGSEIEGGIVTGARIRTAEYGARIEFDPNGFFYYDDYSRRVALGTNPEANISGHTYYNSGGQSQGLMYAVQNELHVMGTNALRLGSLYGRVVLQGTVNFQNGDFVTGLEISSVNGLQGVLNSKAVNMAFDTTSRNLKLFDNNGNTIAQVNIPK